METKDRTTIYEESFPQLVAANERFHRPKREKSPESRGSDKPFARADDRSATTCNVLESATR